MLSNRCATEIAFAGPSVIAAPDIPTDFSMLTTVHNYQCRWQFQVPTGELINRPVYVLPVLLAQYEDPQTVLARLINLVLKTSASSVVQRSMLTMSQSAQTAASCFIVWHAASIFIGTGITNSARKSSSPKAEPMKIITKTESGLNLDC